MAKVFTIDFTYKANIYTALVTLKTKGDEQVVYVQFFEEQLTELLAGEELEFTLANGLKRHTDTYNPKVRELILPLKEAVLQHLKTSEHKTV